MDDDSKGMILHLSVFLFILAVMLSSTLSPLIYISIGSGSQGEQLNIGYLNPQVITYHKDAERSIGTNVSSTYPVIFTEFGLSENASWSLSIANLNGTFSKIIYLRNSSITIYLENGSYFYLAEAASNNLSYSERGRFTVSSDNASINNIIINFPHQFYSVLIKLQNVQNNFTVGIKIDSVNNSISGFYSTNKTSLSIVLPNGSYNIIPNLSLKENNSSIAISEILGPLLNVSGSNVSYNLTFPKFQLVTIYIVSRTTTYYWFLTGSYWNSTGLGLFTGSFSLYSSNRAETIFLPEGIYYYDLYIYNSTMDLSSRFFINGSTTKISLEIPMLYKIEFIPNESFPFQSWGVYVVSKSYSEGNNSQEVSMYGGIQTNASAATLLIPNGTYDISAAGYGIPSIGINIFWQINNFSVNGQNKTVRLFPEIELFNVNFSIPNKYLSGLVGSVTDIMKINLEGNWSGHNLSVYVNVSKLSNSTSLEMVLPNGSYNYTLTLLNLNYNILGQFRVIGENLNVNLQFPFSNMIIKVTDMPPDTVWNITITGNGLTYYFSTANKSISFYLLDGFYFYQIDVKNLIKYEGNFQVVNSSSNILIHLPLYEIIFKEQGLPNGTEWYINFNGSLYYSNSSVIVVYVANGSFWYEVGNVPGYKENSRINYIIELGNNNTIYIQFRPATNALSFTITTVLGIGVALIFISGFLALYFYNRRKK